MRNGYVWTIVIAFVCILLGIAMIAVLYTVAAFEDIPVPEYELPVQTTNLPSDGRA